MADYLPQDALIEIFTRASIKTLLCCTAVCKSWHSIIMSPSFAQAHLNQQKTTRDLLIIRASTVHSQKEVYSWRFDDVGFNEVGCNSPYDHPYNNYFRILDSCNGVLCLLDDLPTYSEDTFLWNPAIRVWIKLPPQPVTRNSYLDFDPSTIFGVDPSSNDYKVIRITYRMKGPKVVPNVLKYTLSSNTWENVSHLAKEFKHLRTRCLAKQVYFNGASHWIVMDQKRGCLAVLLFHFAEDVFLSMELPGDVAFTNWYGDLRPVVFKGLFSVVETKLNAKKCFVWAMEQYGVESSWVKRFDINFGEAFDRIIGFRKDGRFLVDKKGKLCSYNPEAKDGSEPEEQLSDLGINSREIGFYRYSLHVVGYVESFNLMGRQADILEE